MIAIIATNHSGHLGIEAEQVEHRAALLIKCGLARRHLDALGDGIARRALPLDIDAPQRRTDDGMGDHHAKRDPRLGQQRRAHGSMTVQVDIIAERSEEHTSELQSLMRISYAALCLKKKKK